MEQRYDRQREMDERRRVEEEAFKRYEEYQRLMAESQLELHKELEDFNFDLLRDIFKDLFKKSGAENHPINIVPLEKIWALRGENDPTGHYSPYRSKEWLGVHLDRLREQYPDPMEFKVNLIHVFIHELTHAVSTTPDYDYTGFKRLAVAPSAAWNEGVTEKLAQQVTKEYLTATGYSGRDFFSNYQPFVAFVDLVVKHISEQSGVQEEKVWGAITRAYLTEHRIGPELEREGLLPRKFLEKIDQAQFDDIERWLEQFPEMELSKTVLPKQAQVIEREVEKFVGKPALQSIVDRIRSVLGF